VATITDGSTGPYSYSTAHRSRHAAPSTGNIIQLEPWKDQLFEDPSGTFPNYAKTATNSIAINSCPHYTDFPPGIGARGTGRRVRLGLVSHSDLSLD
jgi:hypothetical protein